MNVIDLTQTIEPGMPVFPGDNPISLEQFKFIETDAYRNSILKTAMHCGTHLDGPGHFLQDAPSLDLIDPARFCGSCCILDVRGSNPIRYDQAYEDIISEDQIVLVYTGHSQLWGTEKYFLDYPVLTQEIVDLFIRKRIKILGMDTPSPDASPYPMHAQLFSAGILILESLTNLHLLDPDSQYFITALPLKIKADSSPCRVLAIRF